MFDRQKVFRLQRSRQFGDVVSILSKDRKQALHLPMTERWKRHFGKRFTFYAIGSMRQGSQPRFEVLRETTQDEW